MICVRRGLHLLLESNLRGYGFKLIQEYFLFGVVPSRLVEFTSDRKLARGAEQDSNPIW